jgi:hypothetical protein
MEENNPVALALQSMQVSGRGSGIVGLTSAFRKEFWKTDRSRTKRFLHFALCN